MSKMIHSTLFPNLSQGGNKRKLKYRYFEDEDLVVLEVQVNAFIVSLENGLENGFYVLSNQYSNYNATAPVTPMHVALITYILVD